MLLTNLCGQWAIHAVSEEGMGERDMPDIVGISLDLSSHKEGYPLETHVPIL